MKNKEHIREKNRVRRRRRRDSGWASSLNNVRRARSSSATRRLPPVAAKREEKGCQATDVHPSLDCSAYISPLALFYTRGRYKQYQRQPSVSRGFPRVRLYPLYTGWLTGFKVVYCVYAWLPARIFCTLKNLPAGFHCSCYSCLVIFTFTNFPLFCSTDFLSCTAFYFSRAFFIRIWYAGSTGRSNWIRFFSN